MIYYSTGKGQYMKSVGKAVELDDATAEILIKKGYIVANLSDVNCKKEVAIQEVEPIAEVIETVEIPVEKVVKVEKPKGRPKGKVVTKKVKRK